MARFSSPAPEDDFLVHDQQKRDKKSNWKITRMLEVSNINKNFVHQNTLQDINLKIERGEFFSLLGPSGCGKTTLLRILAGLETPTSGQILVQGQQVQNLPAQSRPFNMVFQRYALFPHLTVAENIAFGLRMKKVPWAEREERVQKMLSLVGLDMFSERFPDTLSGGQAQRVALARALINQPQVLLLDEPLSALDLKMREHMQTELRSLQKKLGLTFIFVTHDQEEALALSDRIAVMNHGRIEQISTPQELYEKPATQFVAEFIGNMNKLAGEVEAVEGDQVICRLGGQKIRGYWVGTKNFSPGQKIDIYLRPENLDIRPGSHSQSMRGEVVQKIFKGDHYELQLDMHSQFLLKVQLPCDEAQAKVGEQISVFFSLKDVFVFGGAQA